jgi:hypothetical protein
VWAITDDHDVGVGEQHLEHVTFYGEVDQGGALPHTGVEVLSGYLG